MSEHFDPLTMKRQWVVDLNNGQMGPKFIVTSKEPINAYWATLALNAWLRENGKGYRPRFDSPDVLIDYDEWQSSQRK